MALEKPKVEPVSSERAPLGLSFGDGFQFGCGFFAAGLIALIIVVLLILLLLLLLSLAGFGLFGDFLSSSSWPAGTL